MDLSVSPSSCRFCTSAPLTELPAKSDISSPMSIITLLKMRSKIESDTYRDDIDREFSAIVEETAFVQEPLVTMRQEDVYKNRYFNVFPYEYTRVRLAGAEDYINASYIDGEVPGKHHRYICTQGPLVKTLVDFWSMVWQENSSVIIMLTAETEADHAKSERYWPDKCNGGGVTYGPFNVIMVSESSVPAAPSLSVRKFNVSFSGQTRTILHIQYPDWSDFGVPSGTKGLVTAIGLIRDCETAAGGPKGPLVVHCSAGIGRTGVFVAAHSTLERLEYCHGARLNEIVDMPRTVCRLRSQRGGMVQTVEQYRFSHLVVADGYKLWICK